MSASLAATVAGGNATTNTAALLDATAAVAPTLSSTTAAQTPAQQYHQSIGRSKEPAIVAAEKLMAVYTRFEGLEEILTALDPAITFIAPMAYYRGRPVVRSWIQFEAKLLVPFHPYMRVKDITSEDEMKAATIRWSVGGLHFVDKIHLSQLLQYQTITRTMTREFKTLDDKLIAEEVLRLWTGPHFATHCEPKMGSIDNSALVLPTLDYSHSKLRDFKQLLTAAPSMASSARPITDMNVVYHFMAEGLIKSQIESEKKKEADEEKSRKTNFAKAHGEQFVIRASNREGEKKVLVIDKADFFRSSQASKVEQMQDDEVSGIATKHDRPRYICSCVRLRNNYFGAKAGEQFDADGKLIEFDEDDKAKSGHAAGGGAAAATRLSSTIKTKQQTAQEAAMAAASASELGTVLKLLLVNSFYFVTNIDLSSNKLTTIPDLSELPLVGLSLHDNRLTSWEDLEKKIKPLILLQNLTLFANPIQKEAESVKSYKYGILSIFYHPVGYPLKDLPRGRLTQNPVGFGGATKATAAPKSLNISAQYKSGVGPLSSTTGGTTTTSVNGPQSPLNATVTGGTPPALLAGGNTSSSIGASRVRSAQQNRSPSVARDSPQTHAYANGAGFISLRSLDHCVVSVKEADIVKTFIAAFNQKREHTIKVEQRTNAGYVSKKVPLSSLGPMERLEAVKKANATAADR